MSPQFPIEVSGLSKSFGNLRAVDQISFFVRPGEIYGLVGPDGAGKTTTLRLLVGALPPDSGEIYLGGINMRLNPEEGRRQVGYLSQRFSLYEDLTVLENIRFFAEVRGLSRHEWLPRSLEILHFVGLEDFRNRLVKHLSGGMKQKLALAVALVSRPRLLFLDEPTTGVDPVTRQDFWQLIIRLALERGDGVAILMTTPYMDEATRCHRVGFIQKGKIRIEGTPADLRERLKGRILEVRGHSLDPLRTWVRGLQGVEDVHTFGDRLHIRVSEGHLPSVLQHLEHPPQPWADVVNSVRPISPTLEDAFIAFASMEEG